ncbi:MAG: Methionyl-tRNA formyltransferase [Lentisphaerae bacterium ADurb.Bin242]|nr:MAG: Methionyl-tRNA formyltransferase [Lentisphaerae bacterium ADurb.Bin242]
MVEMEHKIRIVFLGSGMFAVPVLEGLRQSGELDVVHVITQPDKPAGRKNVLTPTPVGKWCDAHGIACERVASVNDPVFLSRLRGVMPDMLVVVSFGQLLKEELLSLPKLGCLNVHASLLPRYRGASPVASAVLNGEKRTGVSFMRMDKGLDTGPVYETFPLEIAPGTTAAALEQELAQAAGRRIAGCVLRIADGSLRPVPQNNAEATLSRKIRKAHGSIVWEESAEQIARKIRAFQPWPSAIFTFPHQGRNFLVKILSGQTVPFPAPAAPGRILAIAPDGITVACGTDALRIERVIPEGKKEMGAADFARGFRLEPGMEFSGGPGAAPPKTQG